MGNKIKDLGEVTIGNQKFIIELNEGTKTERYNIHIQNKLLKICYKDIEFAEFAASFMLAKNIFENLKGIK